MDIGAATRTRLATVALATFAFLVGGMLPASAAPSSYDYHALGDSYAAGLGVSPDQAYPSVLDGRMRISLDENIAVSGATVSDLVGGQLGALDEDTDLVTISVGGNDIAWIQAITTCLLADDQVCAAAVAGSSDLITGVLPGMLDAAYAQVRLAAPNAAVVVTGYPRLFSPEDGDYLPLAPNEAVKASVAEQQMMNAAADLLNVTIRGAAEAHDFQFVDVTDRFDGHGVNADESWIFGVLTPAGGINPAAFHPTVDGQHAYGVALRSQINPNSLR